MCHASIPFRTGRGPAAPTPSPSPGPTVDHSPVVRAIPTPTVHRDPRADVARLRAGPRRTRPAKSRLGRASHGQAGPCARPPEATPDRSLARSRGDRATPAPRPTPRRYTPPGHRAPRPSAPIERRIEHQLETTTKLDSSMISIRWKSHSARSRQSASQTDAAANVRTKFWLGHSPARRRFHATARRQRR